MLKNMGLSPHAPMWLTPHALGLMRRPIIGKMSLPFKTLVTTQFYWHNIKENVKHFTKTCLNASNLNMTIKQ